MNWAEGEPGLRAAYRLLENENAVSGPSVYAALGPDLNDERDAHAWELLDRDDFIELEWELGSAMPVAVMATGKGQLEAAGWPKEADSEHAEIALLLRLLDERIA